MSGIAVLSDCENAGGRLAVSPEVRGFTGDAELIDRLVLAGVMAVRSDGCFFPSAPYYLRCKRFRARGVRKTKMDHPREVMTVGSYS